MPLFVEIISQRLISDTKPNKVNEEMSNKYPIRLGLTMWSHNQWQHSFYGSGTKPGERLARYAQVFHSVEGNTTFYANPSPSTVNNWNAATSDDFRFTFKLPSTITHQQKLNHSDQLVSEFIHLMEPLHHKIGLWKIQLPAAFSPHALPVLERFIDRFPKHLPLGVEVRHLGFFDKGEQEKQLNRMLIEKHVDRIIMDSRPVFSAPPTTEAVIEAHNNKPKVPVHAIATANTPMMRFIGHPDLVSNDAFFTPWLSKLENWVKEGKQPFVFIHTPDNVEAPELADRLYHQLQQRLTLPDLSAINPEPPSNQLSLL